ncbi:MAG: sodium:solute symporter [Candidatus Hydrogenedentes bacterium]|nr:sodium:solute symporter [Candidatus Hydrogenedentota bacterium]
MLNGMDWIVIGGYFLVVFAVAWWASRGEKNHERNSADYFLAGRNAGWFVIGGSLFASNIGSEHLIGLAGTGAASGLAVAQFEIQASLILLLLGWFFVPFYLRSGVYTMPEFMERRYSPTVRWYLALISVVGYVLTKISVTIAAGGIVFESLMGMNFWTGAILVVVATGAYTVLGGLRAVLYTDLLQVFVLVGGSVLITVVGINQAGGWTALREAAPAGFFSVWKPMTDPAFPWTGILFGAPILGVWYWCTDQFIVQRVLAAHGEDDARRGTIMAGFLKQLPLFIFVIPGIVAYVLSQQGALTLERSDAALPTLVATVLPMGLRGVVVAGLLAALMSSLSSVFNSCSTLITWDIYRKMRPDATEKTLVRVGQWSTGVLVVLGLLWIPLMAHVSEQLYQYLQSVQAYIAPPIAAVFLIGLLWGRVNAQGAIASLLTGFLLGMGRLALELNKDSLSGFALELASINFLHYACLLFVVCSGVLVLVSLATPAPSTSQVHGLTHATVKGVPTLGRPVSASWRAKDVGLSLVLFGIVAFLWIYFRG